MRRYWIPPIVTLIVVIVAHMLLEMRPWVRGTVATAVFLGSSMILLLAVVDRYVAEYLAPRLEEILLGHPERLTEAPTKITRRFVNALRASILALATAAVVVGIGIALDLPTPVVVFAAVAEVLVPAAAVASTLTKGRGKIRILGVEEELPLVAFAIYVLAHTSLSPGEIIRLSSTLASTPSWSREAKKAVRISEDTGIPEGDALSLLSASWESHQVRGFMASLAAAAKLSGSLTDIARSALEAAEDSIRSVIEKAEQQANLTLSVMNTLLVMLPILVSVLAVFTGIPLILALLIPAIGTAVGYLIAKRTPRILALSAPMRTLAIPLLAGVGLGTVMLLLFRSIPLFPRATLALMAAVGPAALVSRATMRVYDSLGDSIVSTLVTAASNTAATGVPIMEAMEEVAEGPVTRVVAALERAFEEFGEGAARKRLVSMAPTPWHGALLEAALLATITGSQPEAAKALANLGAKLSSKVQALRRILSTSEQSLMVMGAIGGFTAALIEYIYSIFAPLAGMPTVIGTLLPGVSGSTLAPLGILVGILGFSIIASRMTRGSEIAFPWIALKALAMTLVGYLIGTAVY